jgi:hypothetical protein
MPRHSALYNTKSTVAIVADRVGCQDMDPNSCRSAILRIDSLPPLRSAASGMEQSTDTDFSSSSYGPFVFAGLKPASVLCLAYRNAGKVAIREPVGKLSVHLVQGPPGKRGQHAILENKLHTK